MKKLILLTLLLTLNSFGQDVDSIGVRYFFSDTLASTVDTIDLAFSSPERFTDYSISAYTTTGADTITVYTQSKNGLFWNQQGLVDLTSNTNATTVIASTTPKEFIINDPQPIKIRLLNNSTGSTVILVCGKYKP